jgi:hypothetical protein
MVRRRSPFRNHTEQQDERATQVEHGTCVAEMASRNGLACSAIQYRGGTLARRSAGGSTWSKIMRRSRNSLSYGRCSFCTTARSQSVAVEPGKDKTPAASRWDPEFGVMRILRRYGRLRPTGYRPGGHAGSQGISHILTMATYTTIQEARRSANTAGQRKR